MGNEEGRNARLAALVRAFAGLRVLVVGDMVADEYIIGAPQRISREAPVIILKVGQQFTVPGGATNPGVNARTLGAVVSLCGVIGDDLPGQRLRAELMRYGISMDGLVGEPGRPTSSKTRIVAGDRQIVQQQMVRLDVISENPLSEQASAAMCDFLASTVPEMDAIILSDYDGGVIGPEIIQTVLSLAKAHHRIIVVDSHGDLTRFQGATALTPNQPEAEGTLGWQITDTASLERGGRELLAMTGAAGVLITRGAEGMSLFEREKPPLHIPPTNLGGVFDPTGAGDTVAATFTLALAAKASMGDAATLANLAAGLVVRVLGCATNSADELIHAISELPAE